jgi:hypothetical protein
VTEAVDHVIPISRLVKRMENHQEEFRLELARLPWWSIKRRWMCASAIAVYTYEIEALLKLGGQSQPIWQKLRANP